MPEQGIKGFNVKKSGSERAGNEMSVRCAEKQRRGEERRGVEWKVKVFLLINLASRLIPEECLARLSK